MSWWGKLVGGTFGFFLGGPLGAMFGMALGHNIDTAARTIGGKLSPGDQERVQMAFFTATFSVMGAVAKADGKVSSDEISLAETVMDKMNLSGEMRQAAMRLFIKGKQDDFPLEEVMLQFRQECHRRANLMRMFIELQVQAAYADGDLHPAEEQLLLKLCQMLGFHESVFRQIEALVQFSMGLGDGQYDGGQHQSGNRATGSVASKAAAYAILEVTPQHSQADIKKAYRRLMSQHHPDKLVSKGLPEEMMKLATEKTQKIREAYDLLKA
jgi:DnaJ like chaperone protein